MSTLYTFKNMNRAIAYAFLEYSYSMLNPEKTSDEAVKEFLDHIEQCCYILDQLHLTDTEAEELIRSFNETIDKLDNAQSSVVHNEVIPRLIETLRATVKKHRTVFIRMPDAKCIHSLGKLKIELLGPRSAW